jgi:hypothetical protein
MDTGATHSFVSSGLISAAGIVTKPLVEAFVAQQADGSQITVQEQVDGTLRFRGNVRAAVTLRVLPSLLTGVDVILGMDWLHANNVVLHTGSDLCTLRVRGRTCTLRPQPQNQPVSPGDARLAAFCALRHSPQFMTGEQARRALKEGCHSWLAVVQLPSPRVEVQASVASVVGDAQPSADSGVNAVELQQLLKKHESVFQPLRELPPMRDVHHTIPTVPGAPPPYRKSYRLSPAEQQEVKQQVADLLEKGYIEPSCSPYGAPVLFVQKKDGTLRMCVDYRALNKVTVRDRYPLPRIDDLLDKIGKCSVFSSLDLQAGYHQVRIPAEDVPKTSFVTDIGQFQYKVLCFGLTNAPATFQRLMNHVFRECIGKYVLVYLDDILVMSETPEEHLKHLDQVLRRLSAHKLFAKLSKCEWARTSLKFLGHVVSAGSVSVDPDKAKALREWSVPRDLKSLRGFLGLANYFRKFIPHYSEIAAPLTDMTGPLGKEYPWQAWRDAELAAFTDVKGALTNPPVLALPDFTKPFTVMSDASDVGCGAVLLQDGRPVAYTSHKFTPPERRYTVGERELLALVRALGEWRCYLEGSEVVLLTDHKPLVYIQTQATLSHRQTRWVEFLSRFNCCVEYLKGSDNIADPLSRDPAFVAVLHNVYAAVLTRARTTAQAADTVADSVMDDSPSRGEENDASDTHNIEVEPSHVHQESATEGEGGMSTDQEENAEMRDTGEMSAPMDAPASEELLVDIIRRSYASDKRFADPQFTRPYVQDSTGLWLLGSRVTVPDVPELRNKVIAMHHEPVWAAHRGINRTVELVARDYWWPTLRADVTAFVQTCDSCQRMKASNQRKGGELLPLPVPERPWSGVSMDLIVKLPRTDAGYDSVLVFVDRLTKYALFVPTVETLTAKQFAELFMMHVVARFGLPDTVVSDRGPQFNNEYWREVCGQVDMLRCLSSAYHPQTDGQTERMNRVLEDMLRHYVSPTTNDWDTLLPMAQFAVNNSWQEAVQTTPFVLNHGWHPRTPASAVAAAPIKVPSAAEYVTAMREELARAKKCMRAAQDRMATQANTKRRPVQYAVDQLVMLSTANLRSRPGAQQSRKLQPRWVGPFEILSLVGKAAVRLHLTKGYERIHDVFHVSLIRPYKPREGEQTWMTQPLPLRWEGNEPMYEVEAVLDHQCKPLKTGRGARRRAVPGQSQITAYYVKWRGYGADHNQWLPAEDLAGAAELVAAYRRAKGLSEDAYACAACAHLV